jgi:hypothetical protein
MRISSCADARAESDVVLFIFIGFGSKVGAVDEAVPLMKDGADEWFG